VLNEKAIARARKLGRHVAKAMGKPAAQMEWMGDEPGMCPVCHLNQLTITKKNPIECPICGISGELKIKNGEITVTFSEKEQRKSRLTLAGSLEHWDEYHPANQEIAYESQQTSTIPQSQEKQLMNEIAKKLEKYKSYKTCIKPPSKMSKKATVQQV
jgi:hypothetical protein